MQAENHMAQWGREVVIKAIAQPIPTYGMGVYKFYFGL
jgi:hypothetical protein